MSIKLNDLLKIQDLSNVKIRLNIAWQDFDPITHYTNDKEALMRGHFYGNPNRQMYNVGDIAIGLARIDDRHWLLFDISKITEVKEIDWGSLDETKVDQYTFFGHEPIKEYENLFGRVIIKYHKAGAFIKLTGNKIGELEVEQILPETLDQIDSFPGYKNVSVSYSELKNKLDKSKEWQTALKCRKGVYVISDQQTGKLYVGSAYGKNGIYGRWKTYIESGFDKNEQENGKYPNKGLQEIVKNEGMSYIQKNFHYAILETFTDDVADEYIIQRESYWKNVLLSRKFGYNENQISHESILSKQR